MDTFTRSLWTDNHALFAATRDHPFNRELAAGTLPREIFSHYIVQDAHYLEGFSRALALLAAKGWTSDHIVQFADASKIAIAVERSLHASYFSSCGVSADHFMGTERSPVCDHYVSFLLASATVEPFEVALAALLPCFWIYREVGLAIHASAKADNPYRAWIETYAGEAYSIAVDQVIETLDILASDCSQRSLEKMRAAYRRSAQLEWMFWESAYVEARWPVQFQKGTGIGLCELDTGS